MKRYLSGGGSLDSKREVSEDKVCSMVRAAAALRMRSEDAVADTVSKESASAMKPGGRVGRDLVRSGSSAVHLGRITTGGYGSVQPAKVRHGSRFHRQKWA